MNFYDPLYKEDCPLDGLLDPYAWATLKCYMGSLVSELEKPWVCDTYGGCKLRALECYFGRAPAERPDTGQVPAISSHDVKRLGSLLSLLT